RAGALRPGAGRPGGRGRGQRPSPAAGLPGHRGGVSPGDDPQTHRSRGAPRLRTPREQNREMPTLAEIGAVPKVLLHDHLDGGLRPETVLELARETDYNGLPADNVQELTQRLTEGAHRGHLEIYLDAFRHTVAVMQTPDA